MARLGQLLNTMRLVLTFGLALPLTAVVLSPAVSQAGKSSACLIGTDPSVASDAGQIATLRGLIDGACTCADFDGSKGHKHVDYVGCAADIIGSEVDAHHLRPDCTNTVKKIYSRSSCGIDPMRHAVPCIKTATKSGKVSCSIVPTTEKDGVTPSGKCMSTARATEVACPLQNHCLDAADSNHDDLIGLADSGACVPLVFAAQGCTAWQIPNGVSSLQIEATGAAGSSNSPGVGGLGDGYSATVSGLVPGNDLYVCVDVGGASGAGAGGGGASGVSLGSDFSQPLLVAGGGGGAGVRGGSGGNAGIPIAVSGGFTTGAPSNAYGGSGGDNTNMQGGAGGSGWYCAFGATGANGFGFTAAGPGSGGAGSFAPSCDSVPSGGGGGGGYFGGGGGGAGGRGAGGGGGSDFCSAGSVGGVSISGCSQNPGAGTQHGAGSDTGYAHVILTY